MSTEVVPEAVLRALRPNFIASDLSGRVRNFNANQIERIHVSRLDRPEQLQFRAGGFRAEELAIISVVQPQPAFIERRPRNIALSF